MNTISQRGEREIFDALVIGSGLAGLIFCLELQKLAPRSRIALISKTSLSESNSYYAQGGIATVLGQEDSIEHHIADTLAAGDGLGNKDAIEKFSRKDRIYSSIYRTTA